MAGVSIAGGGSLGEPRRATCLSIYSVRSSSSNARFSVVPSIADQPVAVPTPFFLHLVITFLSLNHGLLVSPCRGSLSFLVSSSLLFFLGNS